MERAAILCLSETKRKKPRILAGSSEKISCIAKLYYPLWAVPWNGRCIIIDGLDLLSSKMRHDEIPDVLRFTEDLKKSSSSLDLFLETLKRHSRTFQKFVSSRDLYLKGIIDESEMLKSLISVLEDEKISKKEGQDAVFVPPIISDEKAKERAQEFIDQWNILNSEIDSLHYAIEVLNEETEYHKEKILVEIEEIRRDYDLRISRTKKLVDRKVRALVKEKEKTEGKIEKACKRRLEKILREKDRLRQKVERLDLSLREAVKTRRKQKKKYPKRSTTRIDNRIAKYRDDIRILKEKMAELNNLEAEIYKETQRSLKEVEEKYRALITEELEKLEILEESRKLEISEKNELRSRMDQASSMIESLLRELIAMKTKEMDDLENKAIPAEIEEISLIGIPFYLVIFESPKKVRAEVYPPMVARNHAGAMQKIRRIFFSFSLESRMRLLLNPRFSEFNREIFLKFEKKMKINPAFREVIFEKAKSNNLLEFSEFMKSVAEGIKELEEEGWVSRNERQSIIEMYVKSIS